MVLQLPTSTGPSIILHTPVPAEDPYPLVTPTEHHLILRLDPALAQRVATQTSTEGHPKDLEIQFTTPRTARITFQEVNREAVLVDLPCIIESQKTIDRKQLYKIADISQMLVVVDPDGTLAQDRYSFPESVKQMQHLSYRWPHGITPPMWNVRTRRFRKRGKGLTGEDVENLVRLMLERDDQAVHSEYSVQQDTSIVDDISDLVANIEENLMEEEPEPETPLPEPEEFDQFPEQTIDTYQGEFQDVYPEQLDESVDYALEELEDAFNIEEPVVPTAQFESQEYRRNLRAEIEQLEQRLAEKIGQLEIAPPNPLLRQRISTVIEQLQTELQEKRDKLTH